MFVRSAGKYAVVAAMLLLITLAACGAKTEDGGKADYMQITPKQAKEIMDTRSDYTLLDVRSQKEFDEEHIKGAVLIPDTEIKSRAESMLVDKSRLILVYCRSGVRSKNAAEALVRLGYTDVREFGGILNWPYETVK